MLGTERQFVQGIAMGLSGMMTTAQGLAGDRKKPKAGRPFTMSPSTRPFLRPLCQRCLRGVKTVKVDERQQGSFGREGTGLPNGPFCFGSASGNPEELFRW